MSRSAMQILITKGYSQCFFQLHGLKSMGTILTRCLEEMNIKIVSEFKLHKSEPTHDFLWAANACDRPLALSKLSHQQMLHLYKSRPPTGRSGESVYRWDTVSTYSDVFHHTFPSSTPTVNIDRHTPEDSETVIVSSGFDCMKICELKQHCVSWTFESPASCHISKVIGVSIHRENVVSGVISTRYNCN
jgi:hypothetical protein